MSWVLRLYFEFSYLPLLYFKTTDPRVYVQGCRDGDGCRIHSGREPLLSPPTFFTAYFRDRRGGGGTD